MLVIKGEVAEINSVISDKKFAYHYDRDCKNKINKFGSVSGVIDRNFKHG